MLSVILGCIYDVGEVYFDKIANVRMLSDSS
jgi:hypothetical protein